MNTNTNVVVVGAGVVGLTTAVVLAEAGASVQVWTADDPVKTTSAAAGAMWGPYLIEPADLAESWSIRTLDEFERLAGPERGIYFVSGIEATRTDSKAPTWSRLLTNFRMCRSEELPDGYRSGWRFTAPFIDMPAYLTYLLGRLLRAGGDIHRKRVASLAAARAAAPIVVNCTGIGARNLVPDLGLEPIRGQLVVTENPGIQEFFAEDTGLSEDLLHIYPLGRQVVLGGQAAPGRWDLEPDPAVSSAIISRCAQVEPRLRHARVLDHRVGLRPTRPRIRLEAEPFADGLVIHNYGHGGAGVTLSWGCALEVKTLTESTLRSLT